MKHCISIADMSRDDVELVLERAASFQGISDREIKKVPALRGRTILTLFYEASTRTRSSFELAATRLSADTVSFAASGSSVEKGESLKDTVLTLAAHSPDAIVVRAPWAGTPDLITQWTDAAIVNAGDGKREHPTQALLDLFTMRQQLGADLEGRSVWIVGDVAHSRVARSLIRILVLTGVHVTVCGPPTLIPHDIGALGCDVTFDMSGIADADVVYTLRLQHERMTAAGLLPSLGEYAARYQINHARLSPNQVVMHPGPVNRGVEMSGEVVDDPQAVITMQVKAGVVVRMAVLYELLAGARAGADTTTKEVAA